MWAEVTIAGHGRCLRRPVNSSGSFSFLNTFCSVKGFGPVKYFLDIKEGEGDYIWKSSERYIMQAKRLRICPLPLITILNAYVRRLQLQIIQPWSSYPSINLKLLINIFILTCCRSWGILGTRVGILKIQSGTPAVLIVKKRSILI